jgi:protein gp37
MSDRTNIEWADHTFNPWVGCSKISSACDHCYAERWAKRAGQAELWNGERRRTTGANWQRPIKWNRQAAAAGKRARVFCASLADVFDNQVPRRWRDDLWHRIDQTPNLDWLLLTKRPQNIAKMLPDPETGVKPWGNGWPNVWLGVSAGNQEEVDRNIPILLATPAAVHFVSLEPLLGPIDLTRIKLPSIVDPFDAFVGATWSQPASLNGARFFSSNIERKDRAKLDWVIVGGESGHNARPMHPDWVRPIRDQCDEASVPFFFKQWGEWALAPWKLERLPSETVDDYKSRSEAIAATHGFAPWEPWDHINLLDHKPWSIERAPEEPHPHVGMRRAGRRSAGRLLDSRIWDEMPGTKQRPHRQAASDPVADGRCQDAPMTVTP